MATDVLLPSLAFGMEAGMLTEWLVSDGASVTEGEMIYALESEKSVQEIESPASGIISIKAQPGQEYPVGQVLAVIA